MITCSECGQKNLDTPTECVRCGHIRTDVPWKDYFFQGEIPELARMDKDRLKVDLTTGLERWIIIPAGMVMVACLIFWILGCSNIGLAEDREKFTPLFWTALPIAVLALLAVAASAQYYIIDTNKKKISIARIFHELP